MPIATIESGGKPVELAYLDEGEGHPVLLIHGFASTKEINWLHPGWIRMLAGNGFRVIAFDNRGHGGSSLFHDPADYSLALMADDAAALIATLSLGRPHLVGYSMGARIASMLAIRRGDRVGRIVLSGNGWGMVAGSGDWEPVRKALLAPSLADIADSRGRQFRKFADQTRSDLRALAACVAGVRELVPESGLRGIENPVLVAVGTNDDIAGSGAKLAAILPNGRYLPIPGRDHMRAVGDKVHLAGALEFLRGG